MDSTSLVDYVACCPLCGNFDNILNLLTCGHSMCSQCVADSEQKCQSCDVMINVLEKDLLFHKLSLATKLVDIVNAPENVLSQSSFEYVYCQLFVELFY